MQITFVYLCDDGDEGIGEVEGMFDSQGELLGVWSSDDATWRNDYYAPFMKKLGITIREQGTPTRAQIKAIRKAFGY